MGCVLSSSDQFLSLSFVCYAEQQIKEGKYYCNNRGLLLPIQILDSFFKIKNRRVKNQRGNLYKAGVKTT
jgi:hypothetical protein